MATLRPRSGTVPGRRREAIATLAPCADPGDDGRSDQLRRATRTERGLLRFYDFDSKVTRTVYQTELPVWPGLSLAPNGRRILFTHRDRSGSDLMLVENFR